MISHKSFKLPFGAVKEQFKQGLLKLVLFHMSNVFLHSIVEFFLVLFSFFLCFQILSVKSNCLFGIYGKIRCHHMLAYDALTICVRTIAG